MCERELVTKFVLKDCVCVSKLRVTKLCVSKLCVK